jgi:hypothetical protein
MLHEQFAQEICVDGIVGGAARGKRATEVLEGLRVDRVEHNEVVLEQGVDHGAPRGLKANPYGTAAEAASEAGEPVGQRLRGVFDGVLLDGL